MGKAKKRPSWVIRALLKAFADKPDKNYKMSRVKRAHPDYLYRATQGEVQRRSLLDRFKGGSGRA